MNQTKLNQIAKDIIKNNIYLSMATSDGKNPWICTLFYAVDKDYTFYYISQMDSLHIKHLLKNPTVAFAIYDSTQKEGTGNGIQGLGKAHFLKEKELDEAFKYYHK